MDLHLNKRLTKRANYTMQHDLNCHLGWQLGRLAQCWLMAVLLCTLMPSAHAGLLSKIIKAGNDIDVDAPSASSYLNDIKLQAMSTQGMDGISKDTQFIELKSRNGLIDSPALDDTQMKHTAFIIDEVALPDTLDAFEVLPPSRPLIIRGKYGQLFSLKRDNGQGQSWQLSHQNIQLNLTDKTALREGIWALSKPMSVHQSRFVSLDTNSNTPTMLADSSDILDTLNSLRNQHIIIASKPPLTPELNNALQSIAKSRDLSITLVTTDKPTQWLDKTRGTLDLLPYEQQTMGGYLNAIVSQAGAKTPATLNLQTDTSGNTQTLLSIAKSTAKTRKTATDSGFFTQADRELSHRLHMSHLGFSAIHALMPGEARQEEMDKRWHYFVPSIYTETFKLTVILSLVCIFLSTSYMLAYWRRFLPFRAREHSANYWTNRGYNIGIFLVRILSLSFLGYITLTHKVLAIAHAVIMFIVRVISWPVRKLMKNNR